MHILIIPTEEIGNPSRSLDGIFQWQQAVTLKQAGHKVGFLSVRILGGKSIFDANQVPSHELLSGIPIFRSYKRKLLPDSRCSKRHLVSRYKQIGVELYKNYIVNFGVPDLIHAHNFRNAGFIAEGVSDFSGIPYVITEHSTEYFRGAYDNLLIPFITSCAKKSRRVSAVSSNAMANLQQIIDIDQMVVLHNLIEPAFYQDSQVKSGGKKAEGIIFLNIASLSEAKNHHLLLRAFASKFKGRNAFLRIGGIGPLKGGIESLALELGIAEQVNFLGLLSRDDVRNEMVFADAFVLSSSFETFGVVLIEAMVCGLPIIATDCGGPVDIVNIDNGLLVESDNISALAEAMQKISDTYHLYDPSKLRSLAIERFGEEAFLHNLMKFYSETE